MAMSLVSPRPTTRVRPSFSSKVWSPAALTRRNVGMAEYTMARPPGSRAPAPADVADGPCIGAAPDRLELVDDLHGPHLRSAAHGTGGKRGGEGGHRVQLRPETAPDLAHEMHHVRVALDGHEGRQPHRAELRHPADVVPPQVHQHQVLGPL